MTLAPTVTPASRPARPRRRRIRYLDVIDARVVADHQFERQIDLIIDALRTRRTRLDRRHLRARLPRSPPSADDIAAAASPENTSPYGSTSPARLHVDPQRHATTHEGGVQPVRGIVGAGDLSKPVRSGLL